MEGSARRIDELRHFFLAQNRGQAMSLFRIGGVGHAPRLFERLDVEEPQRTQISRHRTRRQLPLCEQVRLILPNVLRAQAIGRAPEMSSESFNLANVIPCGSLGVITTLEFFQHHFSKMGHRDLLVTQNLSQPSSNQCAANLMRSVRRRAASFSRASRTCWSQYPSC